MVLWRPKSVLVFALVACAAGVACGAPQSATSPVAPQLFVANAGDGTVAAFVVATGAPNGPSVSLGLGIEQLAAGPDGTLFVLSRAAGGASAGLDAGRVGYVLTQLVRQRWGGWTRRRVTLGFGSSPVQEPLLAADGVRWAAVAFQREERGPESGASGGRCTVVLIDGRTGEAGRHLAVCRPGETVRALVVDSRGEDAVVYAALLDQADRRAGGPQARLVALAGRTGELIASTPLWGRPSWLGLAPGRQRAERRLYGFEARGGPELDPPEPYEGRLTAFELEALVATKRYTLDATPTSLAFSPAGDTIYALDTYEVIALDLASGQDLRLGRLPERGLALAVDAERAYVATAYGSTVETVDRATGRGGSSLRVGRDPVALVLRGS